MYTHSKEGGGGEKEKYENDFSRVQLCEKREQLQQIISPSFFFFFARAISARENLTGHRLLHRETTSEQKEKEKKKGEICPATKLRDERHHIYPGSDPITSVHN